MALVVAPAAPDSGGTPLVGVPTLAYLKDELGIKTSADDAELQRKLDAALAFYARHVRPLPGTTTRRVTGAVAFLPVGASISGTVGDYDTADLTDYDPDVGVLNYPDVYGFPADSTVTYTLGPIPADHQQAIVWDVAEAWQRTQRGGGTGRPSFGGGDIEEITPARPVGMYPRILALAPSVVA